jgi:hypothetical protein
LAGCPIAPNNYGNDAGPVDAGSTADSGPVTPTPDAGSAYGSLTCSISAQDDLGDTAVAGGAWAGSDLVDSTATTSDGTNYTVTIEGSNANSGTIELEISPLAVGSTGVLPTSSLQLEGFQPGASLSVQDTWTCGPNGPCSPYVTISSFNGQTIIGTFTVGFYQGTSASGATECSLSNGTFTVTIP